MMPFIEDGVTFFGILCVDKVGTLILDIII